MKHKPERLLLKVPRRFWFIRSSLGFCMPSKNVKTMFLLMTVSGVCSGICIYYCGICHFAVLFSAIVWVIVSIFAILLALPTIFIRKDCFECQLGFYIIAHERNHLLLNSSDEVYVEEETLKQIRNQLVPILLSNPKLCKNCAFQLRRVYSQATYSYLKDK